MFRNFSSSFGNRYDCFERYFAIIDRSFLYLLRLRFALLMFHNLSLSFGNWYNCFKRYIVMFDCSFLFLFCFLICYDYVWQFVALRCAIVRCICYSILCLNSAWQHISLYTIVNRLISAVLPRQGWMLETKTSTNKKQQKKNQKQNRTNIFVS